MWLSGECLPSTPKALGSSPALEGIKGEVRIDSGLVPDDVLIQSGAVEWLAEEDRDEDYLSLGG